MIILNKKELQGLKQWVTDRMNKKYMVRLLSKHSTQQAAIAYLESWGVSACNQLEPLYWSKPRIILYDVDYWQKQT